MSYMQAERKKKTQFGADGDSLMMLIFINVMVFVILMFIKIVYQLTPISLELYKTQILDWVALPHDLNTLLARPWVIITHMISHADVWKMIGNMIFLWAFGYLLQDLMGNRHIIPVYFYGCLAGAAFYILSVNIFPQFREAANAAGYMGGGAGVMAVAIAATVTAPGYRVFPMINGGIPLWVITLIYLIVDFAGMASFAFPHHSAHLGGALMGFVYIKLLRNGNDWGNWMHHIYNWFVHLFDPKEKPQKRTLKKEVFYNTKGQKPYTRKPNITQQRVDEILDKISQKGYEALSQEEKDILKKAANDASD